MRLALLFLALTAAAAPADPPADPLDLGPIAPHDALAGVTRGLDLGPGASATVRFVAEFAGLFKLTTLADGPLAVTATRPRAPGRPRAGGTAPWAGPAPRPPPTRRCRAPRGA